MLFERIKNSLPTLNAASSSVRATGRGIWGLAIPAMLSVANFGIYSILQTTAVILAQISILGAPRTILREPQKDLPLTGLFLHSLVLFWIAFLIAYFLLPAQNFIFYLLLFLLSIAFISYFIMSARSKARLLFRRVLFAEAAGFIVLLCGLAILLVLHSSGRSVGYPMVLPFEILSLLMVVIFLLTKSGIGPAEFSTQNIFAVLPSVYSIGFLALFDIALWQRIEIYFVQKSFEGLTGVAIFGLASQLAVSFLILPAAVLEAWLPGLAESFSTNTGAHQELLKVRFRSYVVLYFVFTLLVLGATLILMKFLFVKYSQWTPYIVSIVMIRVVSAFFWFYSTILYATKKERGLYLPVMGGAIVSLAANSYFTLQFGLRGLLVAYALTHLFISLATFFAYQKQRG